MQSLVIRYCLIVKIDINDEFDRAEVSQGRRSSYGESLAAIHLEVSRPCSTFRGLVDVDIDSCRWLKDVTSLIYHAPLLESLSIRNCRSLKEVIVDDVEDGHSTKSILFPSPEYCSPIFVFINDSPFLVEEVKMRELIKINLSGCGGRGRRWPSSVAPSLILCPRGIFPFHNFVISVLFNLKIDISTIFKVKIDVTFCNFLWKISAGSQNESIFRRSKVKSKPKMMMTKTDPFSVS